MNVIKNLKNGLLSAIIVAIIYMVIEIVIVKFGYGREPIVSSLIRGGVFIGAVTFLIAFIIGNIFSMRKQTN